MKFHEGNKFLILAATLAGLYSSRVVYFIKRKDLAKFFKIMRLIPYTFLPVYTGALVKNVFFDEGHFLQKTYSITAIAGSALVNFKLFHYYFNRKTIEEIMKFWDDSFTKDLFPAQREMALIKRNKETSGFIKFMVNTTVISATFYGAIPFLYTDKDLGHPSGFLKENKSPDYELVVGFEMITQAVGLASLLTYDAILLTFMSLEDAELNHLKYSLAAIVGSFKIKNSGFIVKNMKEEKKEDENMETIEKRLKNWIKLHQNLIKYHKKLQNAYHLSLCVQFAILMWMVCLLAFLNLTGGFTTKEKVMSVFFILGSYSVFYRTCNYGDNINITNNLIFEDAFIEAWYIYPKRIQTIFNVIILQSHRPLNIVAFNIYPLGARSFSIIFRTAYAFFSFLMQIMNKK